MSKILNVAASIIILGLAATGSANARALNHKQPHPGYAGPVYSFIQDCDLPSSACSNDERISN